MKHSNLLALVIALTFPHSTPVIAHDLHNKEKLKRSQAVPEKEKQHAKK